MMSSRHMQPWGRRDCFAIHLTDAHRRYSAHIKREILNFKGYFPNFVFSDTSATTIEPA